MLDLSALVAQDRATTAELLAHIAEVDARGLYLPAACPSMYVYCVQELHLSEDEAFARIRAARAARQHPQVFPAIAKGHLNLSSVLLRAPYLTRENANDLLVAAAHKTLSEIRELLADRFPRPPVPSSVEPLSPERFALQCTISRETHERLLYARALLGHKVPAGDLPEVLDQALDALITSLEKAKFAATTRPRPRPECSKGRGRHVPAEVRRAVWERDCGQCAFVGPGGRRCPAHSQLEFDHVEAL